MKSSDEIKKARKRAEMRKKFTSPHIDIPWHDYEVSDSGKAAVDASLREKSSIIGRVGYIMLSCGTGAWRVRNSMSIAAHVLGVTCRADIGLVSLEYTCMCGSDIDTQTLTLPSTGVDTRKLSLIEDFVIEFEEKGSTMSVGQIHTELDNIQKCGGLYSVLSVGLAAGLACAAFCFLLGGAPIEMMCSFFGAAAGNMVRRKMTDRHIHFFAGTAAGVAAACLVYFCIIRCLETFTGVSVSYEAGYICAMLFIIPGFPFITSGIDLSKLDMRSGIERLLYALMTALIESFSCGHRLDIAAGAECTSCSCQQSGIYFVVVSDIFQSIDPKADHFFTEGIEIIRPVECYICYMIFDFVIKICHCCFLLYRLLSLCYFPEYAGLRFSFTALTPSLLSSEAHASACK